MAEQIEALQRLLLRQQGVMGRLRLARRDGANASGNSAPAAATSPLREVGTSLADREASARRELVASMPGWEEVSGREPR